MILYDRLWESMKKKNITQYALIKHYHISPAQITRLKRNESVSTHTIDIFCKILHCKVEDIMEFVEEDDFSNTCCYNQQECRKKEEHCKQQKN